jgi:maleate cis-trans isomerase
MRKRAAAAVLAGAVDRIGDAMAIPKQNRSKRSVILDHFNHLEPWYRLGFITPHQFVDNVPYQFYRLAPPGMMLVTANLDLADYTAEAVEHELPLLWRHAEILATRGVDRIVIGGVPVGAALGRERVQAILAEGEKRTGIPFSTDMENIISALNYLGVTKLAIGSRWHEGVNDAVAAYLKLGGVEVVGRKASGRSLAENTTLTTSDGMRLAVDLGRSALEAAPDAEALLLPGGLWVTIHAIPLLEAEFGKPVLINLSATIWASLHAANLHKPVQGWGRLLAS